MPNSLYDQLNRNQNISNRNMIDQFNQFRNTIQGDPRQMVQQLLNSGKMSQAQFNYLSQMADQFQNLLRRG